MFPTCSNQVFDCRCNQVSCFKMVGTEAVAQRYYVKNVFLKTLQNSQEKACARVSFLIKLYVCKCIQILVELRFL